ncbi:MAG: glycosyl hydrolase 53 family protein [Prolixibacteraceae bacterium]|nr:glycosyl hydrolase 53 family protein [Prolixibacteraceae bacterium]
MSNRYRIFIVLVLSITTQLVAQNSFIIGQDLSYANMMEDCGAVFREDGTAKDVYEIFADNGTNLVRVRVWHTPDWQENLTQPEGVKSQYNNLEDAAKTIARAKEAGMQVMLDIHFSDFWCDPGRQIIPKAWEGVANNETALKDSIYQYVTRVLTELNNEDLMPEYVKIGNENNSGIMTHKGMNSQYEGITQLSDSWARHGRLYNTAIKAIRDASVNTTIKPKIALHVASPEHVIWFYNNIIENGVSDFDIMGFTYYYSYGEKSIAYVGNVIKELKALHPSYETMVVETGYLWDKQNIDGLGNIINASSPDYQPVSPSTQKQFMVDLSKEVKNAGGSGVIFWEPAWVSTPCSTPWGTGSSQEHVAFFDHRNQLNYMKHGAGGWPAEFWGTQSTSTVTLKVDMTQQDVSRGVYVVGTLSDWQFVELQPEVNNAMVYQTSLELNIGDVHAYYFITSNTWTGYENYRETVPEACATSDELLNDQNWTTDRAFVVPANDTTIAYAWASCESFYTSVPEAQLKEKFWKIYPNPAGKQINLLFGHTVLKSELKVFNTNGEQENIDLKATGNNAYQLEGLKPGLYLFVMTKNQQHFTQKVRIE